MSTNEIQRKVKYISDQRGRKREVILPSKLFHELMKMKISMEIFEQEDVQRSIRKSKQQVREGKAKSFRNANEAIEWLKE